MDLTDKQCRAAAFSGKPDKLRDGNGLYLHVMSAGKYWRYDYRYCGKRKTLAMGVYPGVTLKAARLALGDAKAKLAQGIDPNHEKRVARYTGAGESFRSVSSQWLAQHDCTDRSRHDIRLRFEKDAWPILGDMPVAKIRPMDVLAVVRRIESRAALDLAARVCQHISQAMRYAVYTGLIDSDPCRDLKGAIKRKRKTQRYPAIVEPVEFGRLLADIDTYKTSYITALALKLAPHVALRPSELRGGFWSEINLPGRSWEIPGYRMKKDRPHVVPLTSQSTEILKTLEKLTGADRLMFPSSVKPNQPISESVLRQALARLGYAGRHCPHGFRSTFSTITNESGLFEADAIEAQLAHLDRDRVRAAYNRASWMDERIRMMNWWSDQIDRMRETAGNH